MNLILVNQQTEWSVMFYVIHVSPELAPISSPKPLRGDVALQRPRQLFWVCLWWQVHRHLHQYYYNPPPGTFLSSLTTERKGVRGAVEGAVTPTLTYICHFLCNHSCVWVCAYFCQCVCVCVRRLVQACVRDSRAECLRASSSSAYVPGCGAPACAVCMTAVSGREWGHPKNLLCSRHRTASFWASETTVDRGLNHNNKQFQFCIIKWL